VEHLQAGMDQCSSECEGDHPVAQSAAVREPHRPVLFALAVLIHIGLLALLVSDRPARVEAPERQTALVFLPGPQANNRSFELRPPAPPHLPELSPPSISAPQLIAPRQRDNAGEPPAIDWRRDAEAIAREHAETAEAARAQSKDGPAKPKPEFGWSHSATHRIEPMEGGGFVVWINDKCGVAVAGLAMPFCMFGKKPARGDLFKHMDDPPQAGDWKDE
jgi:hypothetical protein